MEATSIATLLDPRFKERAFYDKNLVKAAKVKLVSKVYEEIIIVQSAETPTPSAQDSESEPEGSNSSVAQTHDASVSQHSGSEPNY